MRLESLRGNWVRVRVGSRKINRVYLKEPETAVRGGRLHDCKLIPTQDIKLRYYDLMVHLALQDDAYLEACSAYQEVWDTEEVKKDQSRELNANHSSVWCYRILIVVQVIENIIIYVILAPYNNEQSDMLHKLYADQALQKAPIYLYVDRSSDSTTTEFS